MANTIRSSLLSLLGLLSLLRHSSANAASSPSSSQAGSANLPSYPLAVKSPFLSTWVPGKQVLADAASAQPQFWTSQHINWPVLARVNGKVYSLFNGPPNGTDGITSAHTVSVSYTSSHTLIELSADSVDFSLDFFSPVLVTPSDYARQSLPYSYLTVNATSTGGSLKPSVQILSGIDQTWTGQNGSSDLYYKATNSFGFFTWYNPNNTLYSEANNMATYGSIIFSAPTGYNLTQGCNIALDIYESFASAGALSSASDVEHCEKNDLAAFVQNMGDISSLGSRVTFAVGFDRDAAIDYLGATQTGYYRTVWQTVPEALQQIWSDYKDVSYRSLSFDAEVRSRSVQVSKTYGSQYADIVEASVREAFGAIELTAPINNLTAPPWVFLKEISTDGNIQTVDVIFQTYTIFISLNPEYIKMLLEPLVAYLELPQSKGWPAPYVVHDLGKKYPVVNGEMVAAAEYLPLFETSTLLILTYAYQKYTGDTSWAQQHKELLDGYAQYLVGQTLHPTSQRSSVDAIPAESNQTALAVQATIALNAASIVTGNQTYALIAKSYANTIYEKGLGLDGSTPADSTHFTYYYGQDSTWNVLFASFSDVLLDLNTFPSAAWQMQSKWYAKVMQAGGLPYAGPTSATNLDINWGLTDWNIMVAAISSPAVQQTIVNTTHTFLTNGLNSEPFGTKYVVEGAGVGRWLADEARSTVGLHFSILALQQGLWGSSF